MAAAGHSDVARLDHATENNIMHAAESSSSFVRKGAGTVVVRLAFLAVSSWLLVACNISGLPTPPPRQPGAPTSLPTTTPALPDGSTALPVSTPIATDTSIAAASAIAPLAAGTSLPTISLTAVAGAPTAPTTNSMPAAVVDAIKSVIQKGNQEEQQAFATHNPAVMSDTATVSYYNEIAQSVNDMMNSGVSSIQLVSLKWGTITLTGTTTAQATTIETWSTTYSDGSTLQETDTNIYTLVLVNGNWKVEADVHPNSRQPQPTPGTPSGTPGVIPNPSTPDTSPGSGQSRNWAGYAATGGTFTGVSGSWTVPNVAPGSTDAADATWVGIGGVSSNDLIQAGTDSTVQSGQVIYTAWWEVLPQVAQPVPLDVAAGDSISVSITQQPDDTWQIVIRDVTSGQLFQKNATYRSSRSSAEWIEESPSVGRRRQLPLDNFGTVTFAQGTTIENGKQRSIKQAAAQPITLYGTGRQPLAVPSTLDSDGASFTVTRTNVPAPRTVP